jgi:lipoate-protein ligase A
MEIKEIIKKLSRLQSKAYNLQTDISILISELEIEKSEGEKSIIQKVDEIMKGTSGNEISYVECCNLVRKALKEKK